MPSKKEGREFTPIRGEFADSRKVACADCIFRDRTMVKIGKNEIPVGVTRAHCLIYTDTEGKPNEIMFNNAECEFYQKE